MPNKKPTELDVLLERLRRYEDYLAWDDRVEMPRRFVGEVINAIEKLAAQKILAKEFEFRGFPIVAKHVGNSDSEYPIYSFFIEAALAAMSHVTEQARAKARNEAIDDMIWTLQADEKIQAEIEFQRQERCRSYYHLEDLLDNAIALIRALKSQPVTTDGGT